MNNDIISLLDFNPEEVEVTKVEDDKDKNIKYIHLQKPIAPIYCPLCSMRMHSKGIYIRTINHPILQNGQKIILKLHQRRWKCVNDVCSMKTLNDDFSFVEKNHRNTNFLPYLILQTLKDLSVTAVQAAKKFNVSDTYVHKVVLRYLDCKRLPLPEILSIDEVYMNFNKKNLYSMVLMDFKTGELIDILPNRKKDTYEKYFQNIDIEERMNVKILVCDMYDPYMRMTRKYFPNAMIIIDSFHIIQWINREIRNYINSVKRRYIERDKKILEEKNRNSNRPVKEEKKSDEVYLLTRYSFLLLMNQKNLSYDVEGKYNQHFHSYLTLHAIEEKFMDLDKNFKDIRFLKEMYIRFNDNYPRDIIDIEKDLDHLIFTYKNSNIKMFVEFSRLLKKNREEIINSFRYLLPSDESRHDETYGDTVKLFRRVSNGPMEGYNRKPKDLKRNSRGVSNIQYTIYRLLWSNRKNEPVRAIPKTLEEIEIKE